MSTLKIKSLSSIAVVPHVATDGAAALDLSIPNFTTLHELQEGINQIHTPKVSEPSTVTARNRYKHSSKGLSYRVLAGDRILIKLKISIAIPKGHVGILSSRSGLGVKKGLTVAQGIGVIDSDYRGELMVGLVHTGGDPVTIGPGDRIAQLMVIDIPHIEVLEVENLDNTKRQEGGFGSTGS
jgi:dUTP pyrophosphatase